MPKKKAKAAPPRIDQVLGMNLERLRKEKGWSQDDLVSRGWQVGLPWSRTTIAALEIGKRAVELGEVILLALILNSSVADLLAGDDVTLVGEETGIWLDDVRHVLMSDQQAAQESFPEIHRRVSEAKAADGYDLVMLSANGEAEQKAARKLGVTPQTIAQAAYNKWGRSLTDERNLQVQQLDWVDETSTRQVQAYRGHVTRQLLDDIENLISSNPNIYVKLDEED
jgi:transcriptional regulator with XRE-family HTH domain